MRIRRVPTEDDLMRDVLDAEAKALAMKRKPKDPAPSEQEIAARRGSVDDDDVAEDTLVDDSIFDWERHMDDKTKRVFYYNSKTGESRWTPPTVKVHEQGKMKDRSSVARDQFSPKPPTEPKPADAGYGSGAADRVNQ